MIDFVQVGNKISEYRKNLGYSQEELAEKLYITRQALSKWENGTSIPSIDSILELSKIFKTSFEDLLCLNETDLEVDENDIFKGHQREYIINKIITNQLNIELADVFYQLSPTERLLVIKNIKDGKVECNIDELYIKLTVSEQRFFRR